MTQPSFCLCLLVILISFAQCAGLHAQTNWPSFRGERAQGVVRGVTTALAWDVDKSEHVLWKKAIPGLGHSSPVIWGDRLLITTAVNQKKSAPLKVGLYGDPESAEDNDVQQWKVVCLNKKNGEMIWEQTAREGQPKQKRHPKATHANCTMATDGTNAVAFFGSEGLYCYDLEGHLRWSKDFGTLRISPVVYNDKPDPQGVDLEWGFASSPVVYQGRIFLQCDVLTNGFITALDAASGKEIWRTRRDDTATWSTPNICLESVRPELVVNGWKNMGGYDLQDGREIWRMAGGGDCPVPTPVFWKDLIFFTSAHGPRKPVYAVKTSAKGDVSLKEGATNNEFVAWSTLRGGAYMQTPLVYDELLFSCHIDGILSCYEAATGKQLYRERLGSGGDGFTASAVASEGKIYYTSEQGTVYVVKPGREFTVLATNKLGEVCMATPAISEGILYFRTEKHLVAIAP